MEKNITKRDASSIAVILYSDDIEKRHDEKEKLTRHISASGNSFTFETSGFTSVKEGDISFILPSQEESEYLKLVKSLEKENQSYAIAQTDSLINLFIEFEKALTMGFTPADFAQIHSFGISMAKIASQLEIFKKGINKVVLEKPATVNDGIFPLSKAEAARYAEFYDSKKDSLTLKKFVPSSGAATRMFKFLNEFLLNFDPENSTVNSYINRRKDDALKIFLVGADKFPFFRDIMDELRKQPEYTEWDKDLRYYNFIKMMLTNEEFDFANKPKGIIPFHQYQDFVATPVYEHLKESVSYADSKGRSHVHFTISEEHLDGFLDSIKEVKEDIEKESGVTIEFDFSYQHKQTDTIAVDMQNRPFRDNEGNLLFRPGGHGALIENLNRLESDIVFIKNIDNVSHNNIHTISLYKKALAGILIELQEKIFGCLQKIEQGEISKEEIDQIYRFAQEELFIDIPEDVAKYTCEHKIEYIQQLLNRPMRVCGMVKNEGEPGGGPFWIKNKSGRHSLQIVESSQIDLDNKEQNDILSQATHFNPVDLVCALKDYKGNYFDLTRFVDNNTGFIVYKNRFGHDVKSYELPGLWNGGMAGWLTVFVEVPLATFNPVKTVNDLLKPAHQPQ